jgi:hypothetical protein
MVTKLALLDIPQANLRKTFEVSDGSKSFFLVALMMHHYSSPIVRTLTKPPMLFVLLLMSKYPL